MHEAGRRAGLALSFRGSTPTAGLCPARTAKQRRQTRFAKATAPCCSEPYARLAGCTPARKTSRSGSAGLSRCACFLLQCLAPWLLTCPQQLTENGHLDYFLSTAPGVQPKRSIPLAGCFVATCKVKARHCIRLELGDQTPCEHRCFVFALPTAEEQESWAAAVCAVIARSGPIGASVEQPGRARAAPLARWRRGGRK